MPSDVLPIDGIAAAIAAIGALGTAAFALVDGFKTLPNGGPSNAGFNSIEEVVVRLLPGLTRRRQRSGGEQNRDLLDMLHSHWIHGTPLGDQKAIAKSLIKLRLTADTAAQMAQVTQVDAAALEQVAACMVSGQQLTPELANVLGRFDLALTALLDAGYMRADQRYRNVVRVWAMAIAIALALVGGYSLTDNDLGEFLRGGAALQSLLCGILATPLAPITKDLTNALTAAVKAVQSVQGRK